jgi:NADPH2:quinone reductase
VEVGEGVTNYKLGDHVLALTGNALAEYSLVQADDRRASKIPDGIPFDVATAIGVQALTAYNLIVKSYEVKAGGGYQIFL